MADDPAPQTASDSPLLHWQHDGIDIYVGQETAKLYPRDQLEALGKYAGAPVVFLSVADKNLMAGSASRPAVALPPFAHNDQNLTEVYQELMDDSEEKGNWTAYLFDAGKKVVGGVVLLPPQGTAENLSGINNDKITQDPSFMRETQLFSEAHEVSHIKSAIGGTADDRTHHIAGKNSGDINADLGAYEFIKENPGYFPTLSDPAKAQAIIAGGRALGLLLVPSIETPDVHDGTAFYTPHMTNGENRYGNELSFHNARMAVVDTVAPILAAKGFLSKDAPLDEAIDLITYKLKYEALPDDQKKTAGIKIDADIDKTGVVKNYMANLGLHDFDSTDARLAILKLKAGVQYITSTDDSKRQIAEKLLAEGHVSLSDAMTLRKECAVYLSPDTLELQLDYVRFDKKNSADPLLNRIVATTEKLYKQGAFTDPLQRQFAENLIAGGNYYLDPAALAAARADVAGTDAPDHGNPPKPAANLPPIPAARYRLNHAELNTHPGASAEPGEQPKPDTKLKTPAAAKPAKAPVISAEI